MQGSAARGPLSRIVLTVEQEQAYRRLVERALAMFHLGDPLARYLYEGG